MIVTRQSVEPFDFGGLRISDYTAGQALGSSLASIEVPSGATHPEAWSKRSDKYYLITLGVIRFVLDDQAFDLGVGDFIFVQRGRHFSYSNEQTETAALVLVHTPSFKLEDEVLLASE